MEQTSLESDTEMTMSALPTVALTRLRFQQIGDAEVDWRCECCSSQIWHNYCQDHDEYFVAGHFPDCRDASHQACVKTY